MAISSMTATIRALANSFHVLQVIFIYNIVAFMLILPLALFKLRDIWQTKHWHLHFWRSALGVGAVLCYFYAVQGMPMTQASAIAQSTPLFSFIAAVIFLRERITKARVIALLVGLLGAMIVIRPATPAFSPFSLLMLAAASMWAIMNIIVKRMSKDESNITQLFFYTGLMTIFSIPMALPYWQWPTLTLDYIKLFSIGSLFMFSVLAIYNAYRYADVTVVLPFEFSTLIFTSAIAFLFFNEIISIWTIVGALFIISACFYIKYDKRI
jgi:drug/metabolite transporter (DMT)-like permease